MRRMLFTAAKIALVLGPIVAGSMPATALPGVMAECGEATDPVANGRLTSWLEYAQGRPGLSFFWQEQFPNEEKSHKQEHTKTGLVIYKAEGWCIVELEC